MSVADHDLCLGCGLCCDGSLFWAVPVEPEDAAPVELDAEGNLRQPCACFNGQCTIYPERPASCRAFECRVLQIVQAGHHDIAWAHQQVDGMKLLVAALDSALPGSEPSVYRRAADFYARHPKDQHDAAFQRKHRHVLKLLGHYETALARFHVPKTSPASERARVRLNLDAWL